MNRAKQCWNWTYDSVKLIQVLGNTHATQQQYLGCDTCCANCHTDIGIISALYNKHTTSLLRYNIDNSYATIQHWKPCDLTTQMPCSYPHSLGGPLAASAASQLIRPSARKLRIESAMILAVCRWYPPLVTMTTGMLRVRHFWKTIWSRSMIPCNMQHT